MFCHSWIIRRAKGKTRSTLRVFRLQNYLFLSEAYMNGELTTKEFVDWYNDPANYRLELPSNNRSHKYE